MPPFCAPGVRAQNPGRIFFGRSRQPMRRREPSLSKRVKLLALPHTSGQTLAMKSQRAWIYLGLVLVTAFMASSSAWAAAPPSDLPPFPRPTDSYNDQDVATLWQRLAGRAVVEPFNLVATTIFLLAICHTFLASKFLSIAHRYEH